tara:strand:- start:694 stop:1248 length:555 start_codon:yes stop_codon:yes gene_type:complete
MSPKPVNAGWIEVICGSMFSGKTEELLRRIRRAQIAKMHTIVFKSRVDSRFDKNRIVSHNKLTMKCTIITKASDIFSLSKKADVIAIDEAQFFDDSLIDVSKKLADIGKRIIIAGLDKDYLGKPFGPMPKIMCEADYLDKLLAICIICGDPASYSHRKHSENGQVVIGAKDKYEARCRSCFNKD